MKKFLAAVGVALMLGSSLSATAASGVSLTVNGGTLGPEAKVSLQNGTTYASLRAVSNALDENAEVSWEDGCAWVRTGNMTLSARPGEDFLTVNGQKLSVPQGVQLVQGSTLVPVRVLAQAFHASVYWNPVTGTATVVDPSTLQDFDRTDDTYGELYWLSHIISAESQGEPLEGQIAVGNVVLNRVASDEFPDTIYDVIFDDLWGVQFEPVSNGTVYNDPTEQSVLAARLCLNGANVIGNSLYFLAPALAQNFWIPQNREYIATIGCHEFYQ